MMDCFFRFDKERPNAIPDAAMAPSAGVQLRIAMYPKIPEYGVHVWRICALSRPARLAY